MRKSVLYGRPIVKCPNCQYEGKAQGSVPGYFFLEILLWFMFIIPGFLYTLWRATRRDWVCSRCQFENVYVVRYEKQK